jgi:hypothetical protein
MPAAWPARPAGDRRRPVCASDCRRRVDWVQEGFQVRGCSWGGVVMDPRPPAVTAVRRRGGRRAGSVRIQTRAESRGHHRKAFPCRAPDARTRAWLKRPGTAAKNREVCVLFPAARLQRAVRWEHPAARPRSGPAPPSRRAAARSRSSSCCSAGCAGRRGRSLSGLQGPRRSPRRGQAAAPAACGGSGALRGRGRACDRRGPCASRLRTVFTARTAR